METLSTLSARRLAFVKLDRRVRSWKKLDQRRRHRTHLLYDTLSGVYGEGRVVLRLLRLEAQSRQYVTDPTACAVYDPDTVSLQGVDLGVSR